MKLDRWLLSSPHRRVMFAFARSLVEGDYERAWRLLAPELQEQYPIAQLRQNYEGLWSYAGETELAILVVAERDISRDGPRSTDPGWACAKFDGDSADVGHWMEDIVGLVAQVDGRWLIHDLVWNRP